MPSTTPVTTTPAAATYARLFPEQLADRCSPDALESNSGPVAYLHALYQQALKLEATTTSSKRFTLAQRRPDIGELLLNQEGLEREIPPLTLAINALTRQAQAHAGEKTSLARTISEAGYRAGLPFHYPLEQIKAVLRHKKLALFDLLQKFEYSFPNFCHSNLRSDELRQVMRTSTGFSPKLQRLLLDDSTSKREAYLATRFGVTGSEANVLTQLRSVEFFCLNTGLKPEQVYDLLATSGVDDNASQGYTSVKRSSAYVAEGGSAVGGHLFGAVFINNGKAPALTLEDKLEGAGIKLAIKGGTAEHFGRIYKLIHLQHALGLPFADVDVLLMSALRAEGQTKDFHITANTLRALGVFLYLKESYSVTAEQFAALIHEISPHAVGDRVPFLDRVLDGPGASQLANIDDRLILDDSEFDPDEPGSSLAAATLGRISTALGMNEHLIRMHLKQVTSALGLKKPRLSLTLLSSLYRLSRLPRLMRLSPSEGANLLTLVAIGNTQIPAILNGAGKISDDPDQPDMLDVLIALSNLERWLRENELSATEVLALLMPGEQAPEIMSAVGDPRASLLAQNAPDIAATVLSEAQLITVLTGDWALKHTAKRTFFELLADYVADNGLIKAGLLAEPQLRDEIKKKIAGNVTGTGVDVDNIAEGLASKLTNAKIKQEDLTKAIVAGAFGDYLGKPSQASDYALPLLKWIKKYPGDLLADLLNPIPDASRTAESFALWLDLARHVLAIRLTGLSSAGLEALEEHPEWFAFEQSSITANGELEKPGTLASNELSLDLLYRLTRYRAWVITCRGHGFDESDAVSYLSSTQASREPAAVKAAVSQLAKLIGWDAKESLLAVPHITVPIKTDDTSSKSKAAIKAKPVETPALTSHKEVENSGTLDEFLPALSAEELKGYTDKGDLKIDMIMNFFHSDGHRHFGGAVVDPVNKKLKKFLKEHPGPLLVTEEQYKRLDRAEWIKAFERIKQYKETPVLPEPVRLKIIGAPDIDEPDQAEEEEQSALEEEPLSGEGDISRPAKIRHAYVPHTLGDIDFVLRVQSIVGATGLSCQSLVDVLQLDEYSTYQQFESAGSYMLGACSDEARKQLETGLQEPWRDALVDYLLGAWVPQDSNRKSVLTGVDDFSSYFLSDIYVTSQARKTTTITQAISSLQHYLYRLFSHLEPGYETATLTEQDNKHWENYLSQYISWNQWQVQINHPENLIYYANRPNKTTAFQELEVEVNQGKLDTELLETAVLNYLTKFERLSNLQIVSGYVDGRDPKKDTYYLIGKTNTSPAEYYLRSVDMGLRDDQQRLSPLAWTEWKKIDLATTGNVVQSTFTEQINKVDEKGNAIKENDEPVKVPRTHHIDAVRPVIIAGRPYVFWVERDSTPLPSKNPKDQAPTNYKRISVNYIYLQSDGFWSTANELMRLDGTKEGKRGPDENNPYLKDDDYVPGLIAFVNVEGPRREDPWLTVILYDSAKDSIGTLNKDYFVEMRDLLLINRQTLADDSLSTLVTAAYNSYKNITTVQHKFNGNAWTYTADKNVYELWERAKEPLRESASKRKSLIGRFFIDAREDDHESLTVIISVRLKLEKAFPHVLLSAEAGGQEATESGENTNELTLNYYFKRLEDIERSYDITIFCEYGKLIDIDQLGNFYGDDYMEDKTIITITARKQAFDEEWNILVKRTEDQAQYLDLSSVKNKAPLLASDNVRLNTLFGKNLVARATQSADTAINWDTQQLKEPTIDAEQPNPSVDFHGANGLYFRELFLHLPALIATRLTEQQQFEDAETWYLRYLFDPYRAVSDEDGRPAYWNTRPLAEVGTLTSDLSKQVDPVARAFILSRYYRQAVFLNLVENWQKQGDHYYRQLTLSTLNHAWLCYQQALKLIGPLPERAAVSRWSPVSLGSVTAQTFRTPVNNRVFEARKIIESRLYNLRHGLTIDGKALPNLGWGDEGGDPFASAKGGLSIIATTYNSNRAPIPAYRFRQLLPAARAAAQQLLDMGRHYMKLMEDEFNTTLDVLLKSQELRISDFTIRLQKEAIASVMTTKKTLLLSKQALEGRKSRYEQLLQVGRSPLEEASTAMSITSRVLNAASMPFEITAGIAEAITPTIFGLAFGNNRPAQPMARTAVALRTLGTLSEYTSEYLSTEAGYERRASEWQFELQQTEWDIKQVEAELEGVSVELNAATISLQQAIQERANLKEAHTAMTTGFTIIPIYNWLVARQELLYGSAYDAVLSLCLSLESAWRFEIGDYKRSAFIKTSAWSDTYKGMLAGESLLVDLQEMENAYLLANERRLTIKKSFSLNKLLGAKWTEEVQNLSRGKPAVFGLKSSDFDKNFPNQYLRQLKHVSVTFVLKEEKAADEIAAILTQTSNTTLIEPDKKGDEYLKKGGEEIPASIRRNLRAHQQIALSSQEQEDGLGYSAGEWVYELMFHDGRYLPFEGTGAISEWTLEIPGTDFASSPKDAITDIKINLVYTALPKDRTLGS